jgi:hypothetical protein
MTRNGRCPCASLGRPMTVLERLATGLQSREWPNVEWLVVIVSPRQTITWAIWLVSCVIKERMATALSGAYMPFRRSSS